MSVTPPKQEVMLSQRLRDYYFIFCDLKDILFSPLFVHFLSATAAVVISSV